MTAMTKILEAESLVQELEKNTFNPSDMKKLWKFEEFDDGTIEIKEYKGKEANVIIPSHIGEKVVIGIGDCAFLDCIDLKTIKLPDSVTSIGDYAFCNCTNLSDIDISNNIITIGVSAFCNCENLSNINLSDGNITIKDSAFRGCSKLADRDGFIILRNVLYGYEGESDILDIPKGVIEISANAFEYSSIVNVNIPDSVKKIENNAFASCDEMVSITIPDSVVKIGPSAFYECENLTICASKDSYTEKYAKKKGIPCVCDMSLLNYAVNNCNEDSGNVKYFHNKTKSKINISDIKPGDNIFFGSYEQDNDMTNGKENIEWLILDVQDGKALLISKFALDCKPYNAKLETVTWETCSIRKWLNNDFLHSAFSDEENSIISTVKVPAHKNPESESNPQINMDPGVETYDKVFLMSIEEFDKYLDNFDAAACRPTQHAIANGVWESDYGDDNCCWWLRTPGGLGQDYAAYVIHTGVQLSHGQSVECSCYGIRPALWIDLSI